MHFSLIISAFIAGLLTFLAPCTLPLVPGYLGFISGVSLQDLHKVDGQKNIRRKILINGFLYILGFSTVFILLGTVFSAGGVALVHYRVWLSRVGGVVVIFFGFYMMHILKLPFLNFLNFEKKFHSSLKPGRPISSLLFGMTFAFAWTPCVGPVLGSILLLSFSTGTVLQGAFLLAVFSLGLAVPFLLIALGIGHATRYISKISRYLSFISIIGGIFLVFLGVLLFTNSLGIWNSFFYGLFDFLNYDALLNYL